MSDPWMDLSASQEAPPTAGESLKNLRRAPMKPKSIANWSPGHGYLPSGARFKAIHGTLGRRRPAGSRPQKEDTHIPS